MNFRRPGPGRPRATLERVVERRLQNTNGGLYVFLPVAWIRDMHLKKQDVVEVISEGDTLIVRPKVVIK